MVTEMEERRGQRLEALVQDAAAGCGVAWAALVERFAGRLRGVVRTYRLASHDADDVLQTTWMRLFEHLGDLREPRAVGAWLEQTARRESLRALTRAQRECPTDGELLDDFPVAPVDFERVAAGEVRRALAGALQELPPRQGRLLTLLMADAEPSYAEISRRLEMPIGSIGPTRERGLERLRRNPQVRAAVGQPLAA